MYVCNFPHNSGTAGPIWINFFLLAPSWSGDGFRPRILDPDSGLYGKVGSTALYTKYCVTSVVGFEVAGGGRKFNSLGLVRDAGVLKS